MKMRIPLEVFPVARPGPQAAPSAPGEALPPPAAPRRAAAGAGESASGAADLYKEGRRLLLLFDIESYKEAVFCFMQVKSQLPDFCAAYASLAETYAYWGFRQEISGLDPWTYYSMSYENAEHALELDRESAEAHRAMAMAIRSGPRRNPALRKKHAQRAAQINPYNAENCWEAWRAGGHDPEDAAINKALALDPSLCGAHNDLGAALSEAGRDDEALYHLAHAEKINPRNALVHYNTAMVLFRKGLWDDALGRLKDGLRFHPDDRLLGSGVDFLLSERAAGMELPS
jgi:tetratricopeptide (TPR) repeat protein